MTLEDTRSGKCLTTWSQIESLLLSPALFQPRIGKAKVINSSADQGSDHYLFWAEFNHPATGVRHRRLPGRT